MSTYLHAVDVQEAVVAAEAFVRGWIADCVEPPTVSRMVLCSDFEVFVARGTKLPAASYADFQGWLPVEGDYRRFVTRGRNSTAYVDPLQTHFDGSRFTGVRIGKQAMVARLYDKTFEIKSTSKE
jgi:hypothetical protein